MPGPLIIVRAFSDCHFLRKVVLGQGSGHGSCSFFIKLWEVAVVVSCRCARECLYDGRLTVCIKLWPVFFGRLNEWPLALLHAYVSTTEGRFCVVFFASWVRCGWRLACPLLRGRICMALPAHDSFHLVYLDVRAAAGMGFPCRRRNPVAYAFLLFWIWEGPQSPWLF